jgi:hypothetical protein
MTLSDISTELLIKLRERFLSGRTRFLAFAGGQDDPRAAERLSGNNHYGG